MNYKKKTKDELLNDINLLVNEITDLKKLKPLSECSEKSVILDMINNIAKDAIVMINNEGKVTYWNKAAEKIFGYSFEDISEKDLHEVLAPERYLKAYKRAFKEFRETGEGMAIGRTLDLTGKTKSGDEIPIEISLSSVNIEGKWHGFGIVRDISERKLIEKALLESEIKYRELVENANSIIIRWDTHGNLTFFNEFAQKFFGYSEKEILGRNLMDTIVPRRDSDDRDLEEMIKDISKNPDRYVNNENENVKKNGDRVWISWTNRVIKNDEGEEIEVLSVGNDITQHRKAEENLRLLYTGINQAFDAVMIINRKEDIQYVNPMFEKLTGFSAKEVLSKNLRKLKIFKSKKYFEEFYREAIDTISEKGIWEGEFTGRNKNGRLFFADLSVSAVKDEKDKIVNFVAIIRDVSKRKELEKKIERLRREYEQFMRHEFKNLISPVLGYTELILNMDKENLNDEIIHYVEVIKRNIDKANNLVDYLKKLQDFEIGNYELELSRQDINNILQWIINDLKYLSDKNNVNIDFLKEAKNSQVNIDMRFFPNVLNNLIKNAIEHVAPLTVEEEKTVSIRTFNENKKVVVQINNKGEPISKDKLELFFEKFNSDRKRKKEGTGLGTTYAYLVTKAHDGEISVESTVKEGTTVTLKLKIN